MPGPAVSACSGSGAAASGGLPPAGCSVTSGSAALASSGPMFSVSSAIQFLLTFDFWSVTQIFARKFYTYIF